MLTAILPSWHKSLPADILEKYKTSRATERRAPWTHCIPHHPLYYIDYPDLGKIIAKADYWRDIFHAVFRDRDIILGLLRTVEPIRNKLAHNRQLTSVDADAVRNSLTSLVTCLTLPVFDSLVATCTAARSIIDDLIATRSEIDSLGDIMRRLSPPVAAPAWARIATAWWFDHDYLGAPVTPLHVFYDTYAVYSALPRRRGTGPKLEAWLSALPPTLCADAVDALDRILKEHPHAARA